MTFWTEQREEQLRNLWAEGHSASFIRQEIHAPSRNAVLGKVHRLGLSGRDQKTRNLDGTPKARKVAKPRKPARIVSNSSATLPTGEPKSPRPVPATEVVQTNAFAAVYGLPQAVLERDAHQCGHPMGEGDQFHYCTNERAPGKHYCEGHHAACWVRPARHKDRGFRRVGEVVGDILDRLAVQS